jgi:hypothetical protein
MVSTAVSSLLPPLNNSVCSSTVTNAFFCLLPVAHSVLQCLIVGMLALSQAVFQSTKQVKIWWLWQYCPPNFFDGLSSAPTGVWPDIVVEEKLLRLCCAVDLTNDSEAADLLAFQSAVSVRCCPCRQEIHKNNSFLIAEDRIHDFFCWLCTLRFLFPSGCFVVLFGQNWHYMAFADGWGGGEFVVLRHSPYIRIIYVAVVVGH